MEPGIYKALPFEEYAALPYANAGALKRLFWSPYAFRYAEKHEPETLAMKGGKYTHMAVLEPARFAAEVTVMPRFHGGMLDESARAAGYNGGKQAKAAWLAAHGHLEVIDGSVRAEALGIAEAVRKSAAARMLLDSGDSEVTLIWKDERSGVTCKARLDKLFENERSGWTVVDLKRTPNVLADAFGREVGARRLHLQAAHYLRGLKTLHGVDQSGDFDPWESPAYRFAWVAFEARPPHLCRIYTLDVLAEAAANAELDAMLEVVAQCEQSGEWPSYDNRVRPIGPPAFYKPYQAPETILSEEDEA